MTTQAIVKAPSLLGNTLMANAVFSSVSGFAFIVFTQAISAFLGWSSLWILPLIGVGLLGFAFEVYTVASRKLSAKNVNAIITADLIWVVLSIAIIVSGIVPLSFAGKWGVAIVADIVATFALLQFIGLKRSSLN